MSRLIGSVVWSVLTVGVLLASGLVLPPSRGETATETPGRISPAILESPMVADPVEKIDAALLERAGRTTEQLLDVRVLTLDASAARRVAGSPRSSLSEAADWVPLPAQSLVGPRAPSLALIDLSLPASRLSALAELPSTIAVERAVTPSLPGNPTSLEDLSIPRDTDERGGDGKGAMGTDGDPSPSPNEYGQQVVTGVSAVKSQYGYTGSGVNIMILDTGVDFGHPSFALATPTKWATVNDPTSPWDGWPIMIDSPSLELFLGNWDAGVLPYPIGYSQGESSWFADTTYEGSLVGVPWDIVVDGNPADWDPGHLVATSPVEGLGAYELVNLYAAGGHRAASDSVGWFFGFATAGAVGTAEFVLYVDWMGPGTTGSGTLYTNNYTVTGQTVDAATAWEVTETLVLPPSSALIPGFLPGQWVRLYLEDGTEFVEGVDYSINPVTGVIAFTDRLYPGHILYADYWYGLTNVVGPLDFTSLNVDPASESLTRNGVLMVSGYTMNYPAGQVTLTSPLSPGDVLEASYTYNPGGNFDPTYGASISATPLYNPEIVFYWQPGVAADPTVYEWQGRLWDAGSSLAGLGGAAVHNPAGFFGELFYPKPNRGDPETINLELYSADTVSLIDTVAEDAAAPPLSAFVPAPLGWLPYCDTCGGWRTKVAAPDLGDMTRIDRNYHLDLSDPLQVSASGVYHLGVHPDDSLTWMYGERVGLLVVDPNIAGVYDTVFVDVDDDHSFADEKAVTKASPAVWQDVDGDGVPDLSGGLLYWMPPATVGPPTENFVATGGETSVTLSQGWVAVDLTSSGFVFPTVTLNAVPLVWGDNSMDGAIGFAMDLETGQVFFEQYEQATGTFLPYALSAGDAVAVTYRTGAPLPYTPTLSAELGLANFIPENGDIALFFGEFDYGSTHGTSVASNAAGDPYGNPYLAPGAADVYGMAEDAQIIGGNFDGASAALDFAGRGYDGVPGTGDEAQVVSNSWGYLNLGTLLTSGWDVNSRYLQILADRYPETSYVFAAGNEGWGYGTVAAPAAAPDAIAVTDTGMMNYRLVFGSDGGPIGCWPGLYPSNPCGPFGDLTDSGSRGPSGLGQPRPDLMAPGSFGLTALSLNYASLLNGFSDGTQAISFTGASGTSQAAAVVSGVAALTAQAYDDANGAWPTNEQLKEFLMSGATDHKFDPLQQGAGFINAVRSVEMASTPAFFGTGVSVSPSSWVPGGYPTPAADHKAFTNLLRAGEADDQTFTLTNHGPTPIVPTVSDAMYTKTGEYQWSYIRPAVGDEWYTFAGAAGVTNRYFNTGGGFTLQASDFPSGLYNGADFLAVHVLMDEADRIAANGGAFNLGAEAHQWVDANNDGVFAGFSERVRITTASGPSIDRNTPRLWLHDPAMRFDNATSAVREGFVLRVRSLAPLMSLPVTVVIEFYARIPWVWLTTTAPGSIPAGGTATFTATASVPLGTAPGAYQGVLLVTAGAAVSTIPVLINVPATSSPAQLGATAAATTLYENGAFRGQGVGQYSGGGDYRPFFLDLGLNASDPDRVMVYELEWTNAYTDAEMFVATAQPYAFGSPEAGDPGTFGPFTLAASTQTENTVGSTATLYPFREFLSSPISTGLVRVTAGSRRLHAVDTQEAFTLDVGVLEVKPTAPVAWTNRLDGGIPGTVWSDLGLIDGVVALPIEILDDLFPGRPVDPYPYSGGSYTDYLFAAPNTYPEIIPSGVVTLEWTWTLLAGDDIDFAVFYDGVTCDGTYTVGDLMAWTASTANPERIDLSSPAEGCYWIHAAGFTAGPGSTFDEARHIERFGTSLFGTSGLPTTTTVPGVTDPFSITWDFPSSTPEGTFQGQLHVAPAYAPLSTTHVIDITLRYEATLPTSAADPLPALTPSVFVPLNYTASDSGGSGLQEIEVWYRQPPGPWTLYATTPPFVPMPVNFTAPGPGLFEFMTRARDVAGNYEDLPLGPDAFTVVDLGVVPDPNPPSITHVPITAAFVGDPIEIQATITDLEGVTGASLWYRDVGSAFYVQSPMTRYLGTDQNGDWRGFLPAQPVAGVAAYYLETADGWNAVTHPAGAPTSTHPVVIGLPGGAAFGTLQGVVTDAQGVALPGVTVQVQGTPNSTVSAGGGAFVLPNVLPGNYTVTANLSGYVDRSLSGIVVTAGATTYLNFVLMTVPPTLGALGGTVTDSAGMGIAGAAILLAPGGNSTTTGPGGSFTLAGLLPGTYSVTANLSGYQTGTLAGLSISAGETMSVYLVLTPLGTVAVLSGTTVDETGAPLPGAFLSLSPGGRTTTTDGLGQFSFAALSPGTYDVTASLAGHAGASVSGIAVAAGSTTYVRLALTTLPTTGGLSVSVLGSDGSPQAGASVRVVETGANGTTATDGSIAFTGLVPGGYNVTATLAGFANATAGIAVVAGIQLPVVLTLALAPTTGDLVMTVTAALGAPLAGATVSVQPSGLVLTTGALGLAVFADLPAGTYTVQVTATGHQTLSLVVTVDAGASAREHVALLPVAPTTGTLVVQIRDPSGASLSGVFLYLDSGANPVTADGSHTFANLVAGAHTVRATLAGFEEFVISGNVSAGESTTIVLTLVPQSGGGGDEVLPWIVGIVLAIVLFIVGLLFGMLLGRRRKPEGEPLAAALEPGTEPLAADGLEEPTAAPPSAPHNRPAGPDERTGRQGGSG